MDLNLKKGDTFTTKAADSTALYFIADSVYYINGLKHIQLKSQHTICGETGEQLTFIEGTGSTAGFVPFGWRSVNEVNSYLLCQHKDGIKTYANKYYSGNCNIEVGMQYPYYDTSIVKVYPNPNKGEGTIEFYNPYQKIFKLYIFDIYGRLVFTSSTNNISIDFSISGCAKGLYFYKLMNDLGNTKNGEIMKY